MSLKVKWVEGAQLRFECPGCGDNHIVPTAGPHKWGFNGDLEKPTFHPSLMVRSGHYAKHWKEGDECWCGKDYPFSCYVCHSQIADGRIQFLPDCTHKLAGQTVDMLVIE